MAPASRIGVYICHCGINIAATVDIPAVIGYTSGLPGVVVCRDYTYMCSEPGQAMIKKDIQELELNRVVVASCSPRMHEPTFRAALVEAGLNPYCLEMANIREQCSWVHPGSEATTLKAMQLVGSAVAKAARLEPLQVRSVPVTPAALVIGGGVSGMQAALDVAEAGFQVHLIERETNLGGHAARLHCTFPTLERADQLVAALIERVSSHPRIHTVTGAQVTGVSGYVGNFRVQVSNGNGQKEIDAGTLVIATGYQPFDAHRKPEFGYGVYPGVITTEDFERLGSEPVQINGKEPRQVVFIQCVGSRDQNVGAPYCSRVCCMVVAKQAQLVRQRYPNAQVTVFFMDVRAFGKNFETFYDKARQAGVIYRRGNPSEIIRRGERLVVRAEDTLLGEPVELETDLVVLAVGMTPRQDADVVASLLKLSRSGDGFFLEAHPKLRPVETAMAGVYLAGCCLSPKDITDSIAQGRAAASSAMIPLMQAQVPVEAATAFIDEDLCAGCGQCATLCAFSALALHPVRSVMTVNSVLCQGCGACVATCPSGAINLHQFSFDQVLAQAQSMSDQPSRPGFRPFFRPTASAKDGKHAWVLRTQGEPLTAVRRFLSDVWRQANLDALWVTLDTPGDPFPNLTLIRDPAQLGLANPFIPVLSPGAARLAAQAISQPGQGRVGLVMRACEIRSLHSLVGDAALANTLLIAIDCLGTFPSEDYSWRLTRTGSAANLASLELRNARQGGISIDRYRQACQFCEGCEDLPIDISINTIGLPIKEMILVCAHNEPLAARFRFDQITDGLASPAEIARQQHTVSQVHARRSRSLERLTTELPAELPDDIQAFVHHLESCAPCRACLDACPIVPSGWFPSLDPPSQPSVNEWLKLCAACGQCEDACPKHVPLATLIHKIACLAEDEALSV